MTRPHLTPEGRRMLKLLDRSRHSVNEEPLLHSYGFRRPTIVSLVRTELAAAEREVMNTGGETIEVVRVTITAAGRKAIEE